MSAIGQSVATGGGAALFGIIFDTISLRRGWTQRRNWIATIVVPILIDVMTYRSLAH